MKSGTAPQIFCINLDRSPHRWRFMQRQFDALGLAYERIVAVNGQCVESVTIAQSMQSPVNEGMSKLLTPNAIGCAMSHVAAYRKFLKNGDEIGVFMEDDVKLSEDFGTVLTDLASNYPVGACVILTFNGPPKPFAKKDAITLVRGRRAHRSIDPGLPHFGAAYVLDRVAAQRLADANTPVRYTADSWGHFWTGRLISDLWAVLPPVVLPTEFASDIGYSLSGRVARFIERTVGRPVFAPLRALVGRSQKMRYVLVDEPQRARPSRK